MDYFYYGTRFLICLSEIFLFCFWINGFAGIRKIKPVWKFCILFAVSLLCYCTGILLNRLPYEIIGGIFLFLLGIFLFQGELRTILFYTFLYYVTEIVLEIMLMLFSGIWMPNRSLTVAIGQYNGFLFELLVKILQFFVIFITVRCLHPVKEYFGNRKYMLYSLPPLSVCLLLTGVCALYNNRQSFVNTGDFSLSGILLILGSISAVVMNIVIVYLIEEIARLTQENKNLEMQQAKNELEQRYYEGISDMHLQYDIYLHDIRRMIRIIAAMVESKQWDNASLLADYMVDTVQDIRKNALCLHEILNALLVDRRNYAESMGLSMTIDVKEPLIMGVISEIDLVALTGNLLDNAINAEKDASVKKGISCQIVTALDGRHIIIEIKNSYDKKKGRDNPAAGKEKKKEKIGNKHGIGLISVQETLRKYGGILTKLEDEDRYFVKVILPSEEQTNHKNDQH